MSSLPHGLPRVGAHEVKRDQPVGVIPQERVTEAETEATGYGQDLKGIVYVCSRSVLNASSAAFEAL
jgi:hypothetical protein